MKKTISIISTLLLLVTLTACGKIADNGLNKDPLVRTYTVTDSDSTQQANYSGEVRGRYEKKLAFQVAGKIINRNVEVGSKVKVGDVLLQIDPQDIRQTVNINAAQVAAAESKLELASSDLQRYSSLHAQGAISTSQLDQYKNAYEVALAAVRQANAQYNQGANQLEYSYLKADAAGVIANIAVESGQVVSAGQTVLTLVRDGEREIEINVPENRVEQLAINTPVQVDFWALENIKVVGKVREISPVADKVTRTYTVRISLLEPPAEIKLGMTANVLVNYQDQKTKIHTIPITALYQTETKAQVWLVREGCVQLQEVKLGNFKDDKIEVISGLTTGDIVVTAGVQKLHVGQKVRI